MSARHVVLALVGALVAGSSPASAAEDARDLFQRGVRAYEAGLHAEAESAFRELLERGHHEPAVLQNLGNSAYRRGRWPVAVYALEWAQQLAPGDEAIANNLAMARSHLVRDDLPSELSPAATSALRQLRRVPLEWLCAASLGAWSAGWLLLVVRWFSRRTTAVVGGVALIVTSLVLAAPLALRLRELAGPPRGVLVRPQVSIKSGPGERYVTRFDLHAGAVLERVEAREDWWRVRVPGGPGGWIPADAMAVFGAPETLPPVE